MKLFRRVSFGVVVSAAVLLAVSGSSVYASAGSSEGSDATQDGPPSICFVNRPRATPTTVVAPAGSVVVTVSAIVDPMTTVRSSDGHTVTAVSTNSGCLPAPGDLFLIEAPNGGFVEASPELSTAALTCTTDTDWETTTQWHTCN